MFCAVIDRTYKDARFWICTVIDGTYTDARFWICAVIDRTYRSGVPQTLTGFVPEWYSWRERTDKASRCRSRIPFTAARAPEMVVMQGM